MFTKRLFILSILLIGCFCHSSFTQERTTLRGHKGTIWSLTFSPDGKTLCSGGDDEIIIVWDIAKRQENFRISHQENPRYIVFSKNGDRLFISRTTVEVF